MTFCQKEEFMCFESPLHHHHLSTFFDDVQPYGILMSLTPRQLKINYDIILS